MHLRYIFKGGFSMSSQAITEPDIRTITGVSTPTCGPTGSLKAAFAAKTDWKDHRERMTAFCSDALSSQGAAENQSRDVRIASRLSPALLGSKHAVAPAIPLEPALRPYRSAPVLDQDTAADRARNPVGFDRRPGQSSPSLREASTITVTLGRCSKRTPARRSFPTDMQHPPRTQVR